jgi:hypothetical protein
VNPNSILTQRPREESRNQTKGIAQKQTKETKMNFPMLKHIAMCLPTSFPSFASVPLRSFLNTNRQKMGGEKIPCF